MPDILDFHNFVLDAPLFILLTARYLWGPADDMLRMILFLVSGWAVVGDMNLYYDWHVPWFDLEIDNRHVLMKGDIHARSRARSDEGLLGDPAQAAH